MPELGPAQFGQMLPNREYVAQSEEDPLGANASEYGGVDAFIQPAPHDVAMVGREQLMMIYNTDSADKTGTSGNGLTPTQNIKNFGGSKAAKAPVPSKLMREYGG